MQFDFFQLSLAYERARKWLFGEKIYQSDNDLLHLSSLSILDYVMAEKQQVAEVMMFEG